MRGYAYRRYRYRGYRRPGQDRRILLAAGAAIAFAAVTGHHAGTGRLFAATPAGLGGGYGPPGCASLERLWEAAGGPASSARLAASVAMAESSGRPDATNYNTNGTVDRGLWQINSIWGGLSTYDPAANARAAVQISRDGTNWTPWTTYVSGASAGRC